MQQTIDSSYDIQSLLILIIFSFILIVHQVLCHFQRLSGFASTRTIKKKAHLENSKHKKTLPYPLNPSYPPVKLSTPTQPLLPTSQTFYTHSKSSNHTFPPYILLLLFLHPPPPKISSLYSHPLITPLPLLTPLNHPPPHSHPLITPPPTHTP